MELKRYDIINALIKRHGYKKYLEIGVQNPIHCFDKIKCQQKNGVDPNPHYGTNPKIKEWYSHAIFELTSDEFFGKMDANPDGIPLEKFDIIFIDGLHEAEQVKRDIANSLRWLAPGGKIVMHDCNPTTEIMQKVPREVKEWTGDVWKALVSYRADAEWLNLQTAEHFKTGYWDCL